MGKQVEMFANRFAIEARSVESRRLVTVGPDHDVWSSLELFEGQGPRDAFVRIVPPADADPEHVRAVANFYRSGGCVVKVLPAAAAPKVLVSGLPLPEKSKTLREVVDQCVDEAALAQDPKAALRAACAAVMDEEGL